MPPASLTTRRSLIGGAALLLPGVLMAAAARKLAQVDAEYQPAPRGLAACGSCASFVAPHACRTVAGKVSPQGWCRLYITVD